VLVVTAVSVGTYANSLGNGFHLDDFYRVVDNPGIQQVSRPCAHFVDPRTMSTLPRITQYRPLLPLTLSWNHATTGMDPVGFHATNLLLHLLASLLCLLLAHELLTFSTPPLDLRRTRALATTVALLFAVHPVSGILVNYVSARDQCLMQVFLSASLWLYLRARRRGFRAWDVAGCLVLLVLSLLSKTDAAVAPGLVLLVEVVLFRERLANARAWLRTLPPLAVVAGFFAFERLVLGFSDFQNVVAARGSPWWVYPLTQARLHLLHYLPHFLWPLPIRQDPAVSPVTSPWDPGAWAGVLFILGTLVAAGWLLRRAPLLSCCILGYWLMLLPTSSFLPLHHLAVDYRPYPSSPYLFLGTVVAASRLRWPVLRGSLAVAAVAWFALHGMVQNRTWRTEETLWQHSVDHGGGALAHLNLAMATRDLARRQGLLEEALRTSPGYILVMVNLGRTLVARGKPVEGLALVERAVHQDPGNAQVRYWYAVTLAELGRPQDGARESAQAATLDDRNALYLYRAARDAQVTGSPAASLPFLQRLRALAPAYQDASYLEGYALQVTGNLSESLVFYQEMLGRDPRHVQSRFNLAHALMTLGRCDQAVPHFRRVLELQPTYQAAALHLQACQAGGTP
jgi:tetratricopeptide (TPR) repeat protein